MRTFVLCKFHPEVGAFVYVWLLLSDLSKFLRASESVKVAGELEDIIAKLEPFKGYKLRAFADFLEKAA